MAGSRPTTPGLVCELGNSERCAVRIGMAASAKTPRAITPSSLANRLGQTLGDELTPVAIHGVVMVAVLLSIWVFMNVLTLTLGESYCLFDIPQFRLKYIGDLGDLIAIGRYFWTCLFGHRH